MRDFPIFTTENGIASLTLREIPYTKTAYIKFQDTTEPEKLLEECLDFCKVVGAEKIYGSNHLLFEKFPLHTVILKMVAFRENLPDTDAGLFPVTEQTIDLWLEIYNCRMSGVPNASYMSRADGKALLSRGDGYFIHRGETLLGIGIASGDKIDAVASVISGAGADVVLALNHALSGDQVILEVASENKHAINLYERLGFIINGQISRWYRLL